MARPGASSAASSAPARAASAPSLARPQAASPGAGVLEQTLPPQRPPSGQRPQSSQRPQSRGFRSRAIHLQVQLQERLLDASPLQPQLPGDDGPMTEAQLLAYSDMFEAVIGSNPEFAPELRRVKEVYDSCTGTLAGRRPRAVLVPPDEHDSESDPLSGPALAEESCRRALAGPWDAAGRLRELEVENRLLRDAAARLHAEGAEPLVASTPTPAAAAAGPRAAVAPSKPRAWSAMRVSSKGVRTVQRRAH